MIHGAIQGIGTINGTIQGTGGISAAISLPEVVDTPAYAGPYEYTPAADAQVITIGGLRATSNITINPIPSNYGLVTWNGAYLTIS